METWRMTRRIRQILPEYATALGDLAGGLTAALAAAETARDFYVVKITELSARLTELERQ